jgi:hypothetical protein
MIKFNSPDLNAPRFKKKRECTLKSSFYKEVKAKHANCKKLKAEDIRTIVETFNKKVVDVVINERNGFELPQSLGYIFIGAVKITKQKVIDYKNSLKHGVLVTHKNWETDGYVSKIVYTNYKAKYRFKNAPIWGFKASRQFARDTSKAFKDKWNIYKVLDGNIKPSSDNNK